MPAKKVAPRRVARVAVAVVLALAVAGPVGAGKKPPPAPPGDRTPPTAPTNLHVTSLGQTSVTLAWNASTDNSGNVGYSVVKDGQGFTVPAGQTTYTIDWLSPGRSYSFYVVARDPSLNQSHRLSGPELQISTGAEATFENLFSLSCSFTVLSRRPSRASQRS